MEFPIGDARYSDTHPLLIAEIGTGHRGSLSRAHSLIDAAAEAGADCIKTQIVFAEEILPREAGIVPLPNGNIDLYRDFQSLEQGDAFYAAIKEHTENLGLLFLATPFGPKSAVLLRNLNPALVKIASPELNYVQLLQNVTKWGIPIILSSGVSTLGDIENAINIMRGEVSPLPPAPQAGLPAPPSAGVGGCYRNCKSPATPPLCILHCSTAYPSPETDYNLRILPALSAIFGVPVGVSDHSMDPSVVPALAVTQGAAVIEKHFCLSRDSGGLDDPIALDPPAFAAMRGAVNEAASACVSGRASDIIAEYSKRRGAEYVEAVLGDGRKRLSRAEAANYGRTNRSIHALRDLHPGDVITTADVACLRTEKVLRPGLAPQWLDAVIGRTVRKEIPSGEGVRFEDI